MDWRLDVDAGVLCAVVLQRFSAWVGWHVLCVRVLVREGRAGCRQRVRRLLHALAVGSPLEIFWRFLDRIVANLLM